MNFTELYQRIRSIDEGTASEPTAPGGVIKTKNADGSVSYKPKVPGERLTSTLPANQAAKNTDTSDKDKDKTKAVNEECGDMPVGMMGMSSHQGQQDSVTMNISMNGSGAGGIRDLMSILRNIESSDNVDVHSHDVGQMFGGDDIEVAFGEEMDGGFGSATTEPNTATAGIDAVTATGNDIHSKGIEAPKVNGGGNPMHETVKYRLYTLYNEIKEAKEEKFDALKHVKNPTKGEKEAAKDVNRGSYADRAAMLKSAEADDRLKKEAYNPNSVDAEHRRSLEKSQEDSLKKKAADGDESAKKRLQALKDKKERMRNDYNARMER